MAAPLTEWQKKKNDIRSDFFGHEVLQLATSTEEWRPKVAVAL
jgi:hypothetical protein